MPSTRQVDPGDPPVPSAASSQAGSAAAPARPGRSRDWRHARPCTRGGVARAGRRPRCRRADDHLLADAARTTSGRPDKDACALPRRQLRGGRHEGHILVRRAERGAGLVGQLSRAEPGQFSRALKRLGPGLLGAPLLLPPRRSLEQDLVGVVEDAVADRIREGRLSDVLVPLRRGVRNSSAAISLPAPGAITLPAPNAITLAAPDAIR